jgi:hypothetical protein
MIRYCASFWHWMRWSYLFEASTSYPGATRIDTLRDCHVSLFSVFSMKDQFRWQVFTPLKHFGASDTVAMPIRSERVVCPGT